MHLILFSYSIFWEKKKIVTAKSNLKTNISFSKPTLFLPVLLKTEMTILMTEQQTTIIEQPQNPVMANNITWNKNNETIESTGSAKKATST